MERGRRPAVAVLGLALALPGVLAAQEARDVDRERPTLLIIDIQEFYFAGGRVPLEGAEEAARKAGRLLAAFRERGWPVVHVQHLPDDVGAPDPAIARQQYRIRAEVLPVPGETLIGKHHANAFRNTTLLEELQRLGAQRLVIAGMQTHMCVEAATRAAADAGFRVTVVKDACATRALELDGVEVPAAHVHAAALAAMRGSYAEVVGIEEWLAPVPPVAGPGGAGDEPR